MTILNNFKDLDTIPLDDVKLMMWDMDGTIVSTEQLHAVAVTKLLKDDSLTAKEIESKFCGDTDEVVFNELKDNLKSSDVLSFSKAKSQIFKELIVENKNSIIAPEILDYFKFIKKKNIPMALVTSSQKEVMDLILSTLDISKYFNFKRCFEDNKFNKPSPDPYIDTLKQANTESTNAIIFEDSDVGFTAATNSKVKEVYKVRWY